MKWALILGGSVVAIVVFLVLRPSDAEAAPAEPTGRNPVDHPDEEDVYALGRAITSEAGTRSELERTAVGWAVVNMANKMRTSVTELVKQNSGNYSGQGASEGARNWYVSTRLEPNAASQAVASLIIAGQVGDPTGGATNFDSPAAQRKLLATRPDYKRTPEEVAADRRASGLRLVTLAGIPEEEFRLWAPA